MASKTVIHRVTMFKVVDGANVQPILDAYSKLQSEAKKDGKSYILRCVAGKTLDDARNQGYGICAQTSFASLDDLRFYDEQCEAHAALKGVTKGRVAPPPLTMFFEAAAAPEA